MSIVTHFVDCNRMVGRITRSLLHALDVFAAAYLDVESRTRLRIDFRDGGQLRFESLHRDVEGRPNGLRAVVVPDHYAYETAVAEIRRMKAWIAEFEADVERLTGKWTSPGTVQKVTSP